MKLPLLYPLLLIFLLACSLEQNKKMALFSEDDELRPSLYYSSDDLQSSSDKLSGVIEIGFSAKEVIVSETTSLAGFAGVSKRLLPSNISQIGKGNVYCKPYVEVASWPRVKAMLISANDTESLKKYYLILSYDLVAISADFTLKIINSLNQKFPALHLSHSNFNIIATHTHASYAGYTENPIFGLFSCDRYRVDVYEALEKETLNSVEEALIRQRPVQTYSVSDSIINGFNTSRVHEMPVDERGVFFRFFDQKNIPQGCFQSFSVHPIWASITSYSLSSDLAGALEKKLEQETQSPACLFLNSSVGNASPTMNDQQEKYLNDFSKSILSTQKDMKRPLSVVKFGHRLVNLPSLQFNHKGCGLNKALKTYFEYNLKNDLTELFPKKTKLGWLQLDDYFFVFIPGEPLHDMKEYITEEFKKYYPEIKNVILISLANDYIGYLMTEKFYEIKDMEACSTMFGKKIVPVLTEQMIKFF